MGMWGFRIGDNDLVQDLKYHIEDYLKDPVGYVRGLFESRFDEYQWFGVGLVVRSVSDLSDAYLFGKFGGIHYKVKQYIGDLSILVPEALKVLESLEVKEEDYISETPDYAKLIKDMKNALNKNKKSEKIRAFKSTDINLYRGIKSSTLEEGKVDSQAVSESCFVMDLKEFKNYDVSFTVGTGDLSHCCFLGRQVDKFSSIVEKIMNLVFEAGVDYHLDVVKEHGGCYIDIEDDGCEVIVRAYTSYDNDYFFKFPINDFLLGNTDVLKKVILSEIEKIRDSRVGGVLRKSEEDFCKSIINMPKVVEYAKKFLGSDLQLGRVTIMVAGEFKDDFEKSSKINLVGVNNRYPNYWWINEEPDFIKDEYHVIFLKGLVSGVSSLKVVKSEVSKELDYFLKDCNMSKEDILGSCDCNIDLAREELDRRNIDWKSIAKKVAKEYKSRGVSSVKEVYNYLKEAEFTEEEAKYGAENCALGKLNNDGSKASTVDRSVREGILKVFKAKGLCFGPPEYDLAISCIKKGLKDGLTKEEIRSKYSIEKMKPTNREFTVEMREQLFNILEEEGLL